MLTVQVESFLRAIPEIKQIIGTHWQELALFKDRVALAPQWDEYVRRETMNTLFLTTARRDGRIVAYYIAQVAPGFHYKDNLFAHQDIMYVVPGEKGKGISFPLLRCVERELRRRRVDVWYSGYKAHNPQGMPRLLGLLGFEPADVYMAKWIGADQ